LRANGTPLNPDISPFPVGSYAAVADLDGDEVPEVVNSQGPSGISQGITVEAWHRDGTPLFGFPRRYLPAVTNHYPMIGDVDGDGAADIVVLTQEDVPWDTSVRILSSDGVEKRRIVIPVGDGNWGVHAALADLDGDGFPEIVVHGAKLYVLKGDGSNLAGWPQQTGGYGPGYSAPVIGDVDGDGDPDVLAMTHPYNVSIWDRHGVPLAGFTRSDELMGALGVPAIADIDLDGRNDIILNGAYWGGSSGVFDSVWALDLHGPAAHGPIEWGQYKGNAQHTGAYETGKNLASDAYLAVRIRGSGAVTASGIDCGSDCIGRYAKGSTVTLTATPSPGRSFARWRGACGGTSSTCQVRVDRYRSVVAEFDDTLRLSVEFLTSGAGTITSTPAGISCPGSCVAQFAPGTALTLTATPAADSLFIGWYETCASTTNVCTLTLNGEKQIKTGFRAVRELTVTKTGTGSGMVTSGSDGISCGNTCSAKFNLGSVVRIYATAGSSSRFTGWSGACGGTTNYCDVTMDQARAVTASFERLPGIIVTRSGSGHGTVTSDVAGIQCGNDCSQVFSSAVTVSLTATPDANSTFAGWTGACAGLATCVVTTDAPRDVDARFEARQALTVSVSGAGSGSVTSTPVGINCGADCSETYDAGTQVTLTATASAGSAFDGWSGGCTGTAGNCVIAMNAAQSVTAAFRPNFSSSSSGGGSSSGAGGGGGGGALDLVALAGLALLSGRRSRRARQLRSAL
jgi:hypothetical protein